MSSPSDLQPPKHNFHTGNRLQALVPSSFEEAFRMAEAIFVSGMYPDSLKVEFEDFEYDKDGNRKGDRKFKFLDRKATASRILIVIQKGMEIGLPPIGALSTIYIVNNRPTVFGDGIPALFHRHGVKFREWTEGEFGKPEYTAHCEITRKDGQIFTAKFSWADAVKAGLSSKKGPWTDYPKRQLQMRARGFAARDGAADILQGLGIYEEQMDIPTPSKTIDKSSLDDDAPAQEQLPAPDNSNLMPDLAFADEPAKVSVSSSLDDDGQTDHEKDQLNHRDAEIQAPKTDHLADVLETPADECLTCQGRGTVPYSDVDEETGEVLDGLEPCPTCKPKKS